LNRQISQRIFDQRTLLIPAGVYGTKNVSRRISKIHDECFYQRRVSPLADQLFASDDFWAGSDP
jgi:hypothetical protein